MWMVSATEASRSFAALLDQVENGATVIVTRGGKRIAMIGPSPAGNGAAFRDLLARVPDDGFERDIAAARSAVEYPRLAWPAD